MKSPIKESVNNFKCLSVLKQMIPKGSVVNSFLFFDGKLELSLAAGNRFVIAHTNKYVIYEFWDCVMKNPTKVVEMAKFLFPIQDENVFHVLQENWPRYYDPYVRSALFFLLNRCSANGLISAGKLDPKNYNPLALSQLKRFDAKNFHIEWDKTEEFIKGIENAKKADYLLLPVGKFNYNFFEHGKSRGFEMTPVDHQKLFQTLHKTDDKWVVVYKAHSKLYNLYKEYNVMMLDKHGKLVTNKDKCEEVVIANF